MPNFLMTAIRKSRLYIADCELFSIFATELNTASSMLDCDIKFVNKEITPWGVFRCS